MTKKTFFISLLCVLFFISMAGNGVLIYTLLKNSQIYQQNQINKKVLDFRNMFTEKVLLSDQEIDFNTRLSLETAVRALNDSEIFSQWQAFVNSKTKEEATDEAKRLLNLLIQKTSN